MSGSEGAGGAVRPSCYPTTLNSASFRKGRSIGSRRSRRTSTIQSTKRSASLPACRSGRKCKPQDQKPFTVRCQTVSLCRLANSSQRLRKIAQPCCTRSHIMPTSGLCRIAFTDLLKAALRPRISAQSEKRCSRRWVSLVGVRIRVGGLILLIGSARITGALLVRG
jgi:hypothetical protein